MSGAMTMVELSQPRRIIHRVAGQDLRILVDHPYVYLQREDVEAIAGIPPWSTGESLLLDDDQVVDLAGGEFYPLDVATARAREESIRPAAAASFLAWLDDELPRLLSPDTLESAHRVPSFVDAHSVAAAAEQLSQLPGVSMGRTRLFAYLAELGWIARGDADWNISALPHDRDWLTLRAVLVGPSSRTGQRRYMQIHVTPQGLEQLRQILTAENAGRGSPKALAPVPLFD